MNDKTELSTKAAYIRKVLGADNSSPIDLFALVQSIEALTLILYPLGQNISGICYKSRYSQVIVINSSMSIGRQRFSLAHELYHLYFDPEHTTVVSQTQIGAGDQREKAADHFASYLLMPPVALYEKIGMMKKTSKEKWSLEEVIRLEQYFGVSHQAMLYRLQQDGEINSHQAEAMRLGIVSAARRRGYDVTLYGSAPDHRKKKVFGHYIQLADELMEQEIISRGKYEELLLDAFREDLVFGEEHGGGLVD